MPCAPSAASRLPKRRIAIRRRQAFPSSSVALHAQLHGLIATIERRIERHIVAAHLRRDFIETIANLRERLAIERFQAHSEPYSTFFGRIGFGGLKVGKRMPIVRNLGGRSLGNAFRGLLGRSLRGNTLLAFRQTSQATQNAVHEAMGIVFAAESPGELNGLVDGDRLRNVVNIAHLVNSRRRTEQSTTGMRSMAHLRAFANRAVELGAMRGNAAPIRAHIHSPWPLRGQAFVDQLVGGHASDFTLIQNLHRSATFRNSFRYVAHANWNLAN